MDLEDGVINKQNLLNTVDQNISEFFYSAAHLEEAYEIKSNSSEEKKRSLLRRFKTITDLTDNNYVLHELPSNRIIRYKETPSEVYRTITFVGFAQTMMKAMTNFVSETQKEEFRKSIRFDPIRINNYNSKEIVSHINQKMDVWGGMSLLGMLDYCISLFPEGYGGLHNRIAALFEFLDSVGYWKDKATEKSNYARLWDSNHAYYATFFDYFISDDKRTRNKAKVVYDIYEIKTIPISSIGKT